MESISFIEWCIENLNYWTIAFLMTIESSFIPFPSEVVVPPAGYFAAAGKLNFLLVVLSATIGAMAGAAINYGLAYWLGRPIVYKFANSRIGHMCLLDQEKVEKAESYFRENGIISTLIGRLVPAVRQLISIPAGLAKMKFHVFLFYTAIGAGVWNLILAAIGYYLHSVVPEEKLMEKVNEYSHVLSLIFLGVGIFVVAYLVYKGMKKKDTNKEASL
ncbi:MAG TPA: DedA family protein [Paludibacteraceae bacterium]|jgi:membrane protein DedA with SNARE-associated domain|nr:DedA family protein [Paludibacteraceae bacterium]HOU67400.1 DedA family protein [Paludibacteraceae bacterium]HPH62266.1 DedA family protein [Paludibacteraceae bacterium]HQF49546.1 DedA family protein [Paludibacteraceae bacterium]HQJ89299.1 DedA family protein [Paludibacteraceae bacterium]